jgi:hypothetical protein
MKPLFVYVVGLSGVTGVLLALLDWSAIASLSFPDWGGILTFVTLAILSQR